VGFLFLEEILKNDLLVYLYKEDILFLDMDKGKISDEETKKLMDKTMYGEVIDTEERWKIGEWIGVI
jgi:hypothetical protein